MNQKFKEYFYEHSEPIEENWKTALATGLVAGSTLLGGIGSSKELNKTLNNKSQISSSVNINEINWDKVIKVLSDIETSTAKKINGKYYGDKKNGVYKAYGPLQIWKIVVDDVNRIYGTHYTHNDAHDLIKASDICKKYIKYYGKDIQDIVKRPLTYKEIGIIWNGGPKGYKSTNPNVNVIDYGERFQNLMLANKDGLILAKDK